MPDTVWNVNSREGTAVGPVSMWPYRTLGTGAPWTVPGSWSDGESVGIAMKVLSDDLVTRDAFPQWADSVLRSIAAIRRSVTDLGVPVAVPTYVSATALWSDDDGVCVAFVIDGDGRVTPESVGEWADLSAGVVDAVRGLMTLPPPDVD
jgi:hypothetical protein